MEIASLIIKKYLKGTVIIATVLLLLLALPFVILISESLYAIWLQQDFISYYQFFTLLQNSFSLVLLTLIFAAIIGISLAWLTSYYNIPFKHVINILILLPVTIPSYILANVYAYIGEDQIPYFCGKFFDLPCNFSLRNILGAAFIFSLGLYPYVYLLSKNYFLKLKERLMVAKLYGLNQWQLITQIALPSSKPAIVAGLSLIAMEVLADFGVVSLFGIETFTTQIYRAWFYQNQYQISALLSVILLAIVIFMLLLEKIFDSRRGYEVSKCDPKIDFSNDLTGRYKYIFMTFIILIPTIAFVIPLIQIIIWSIKRYDYFLSYEFAAIFANSLFLAALGAIIIVFATLLIISVIKSGNFRLYRILNSITSLGYVIPGSVIAIAILYSVNLILGQFDVGYNTISLVAIFSLIYAYFIRFSALSYNNINSAWQKIPRELFNISLIYQKNNIERMHNIYIPLLSREVAISILLISIEIIKELPATLILRPFNFETLATKTYMLASDEMVIASGTASLAIIVINIIPIYFINKFFLTTKNEAI